MGWEGCREMSYVYANKKVIDEIDKSLGQIVRNLDKSLLIHIKNYLEKNFYNIVGQEIEIRIIVDANAVIGETLSYIKNGESFLLKVSESPFLKLFAPKWLRQEIEAKIPELSKKKRISQEKLRSAFTTILAKIQYLDIADEKALLQAYLKIGYKDIKDVPYAALYFSIKTHGVLTSDKHFKQVPEIKVWEKLGYIGKIVTIFEKGSFAFFITAIGLPHVLKLLFSLGVAVLRFLWEIVQKVINAIAILIKGAIGEIAKFPDWIKLTLGIGAIILLLWDEAREQIINALKEFLTNIYNFLNWIYTALKNLLETIAPIINVAIVILAYLFEQIVITINTVQNMNRSPISGGHHKI